MPLGRKMTLEHLNLETNSNLRPIRTQIIRLRNNPHPLLTICCQIFREMGIYGQHKTWLSNFKRLLAAGYRGLRQDASSINALRHVSRIH